MVAYYKNGVTAKGSVVATTHRGKKVFMSAAHIFDPYPDQGVQVVLSSGQEISVRVAYLDFNQDLAILKPLNGQKKIKSIKFKPDFLPNPDQKVYIFSYPAGSWEVNKKMGYVRGMGHFGGKKDLLLDVFIEHGDSGAGVLFCQNDKIELLGIIKGFVVNADTRQRVNEEAVAIIPLNIIY